MIPIKVTVLSVALHSNNALMEKFAHANLPNIIYWLKFEHSVHIMNEMSVKSKNEPYPGTQSVLRAMSLLDILSDKQPEWHLSELTKATNLNRTTVFRLLTALESFDLVVRDPQTERYRLGSGLIMLAGRALRANPVRTVSRPELEKLADAIGEMATLEILSGHDVLVIDEVSVDRLISGTQPIGTRWPAYATSTGNAIMAHLPPSHVTEILSAALPHITSKTLTSPEPIRQRLLQIAKNGYAISEEMLELGFTDVGAPLLNHEGHPVAAISISGPTVRFTDDRLITFGKMIRDAAARISYQLGYRS